MAGLYWLLFRPRRPRLPLELEDNGLIAARLSTALVLLSWHLRVLTLDNEVFIHCTVYKTQIEAAVVIQNSMSARTYYSAACSSS